MLSNTSTVCADDGIIHQRGGLLRNFGSLPRYEPSVDAAAHAGALAQLHGAAPDQLSLQLQPISLAPQSTFRFLYTLEVMLPITERSCREALCLHALSIQIRSNHRHQ